MNLGLFKRKKEKEINQLKLFVINQFDRTCLKCMSLYIQLLRGNYLRRY